MTDKDLATGMVAAVAATILTYSILVSRCTCKRGFAHFAGWCSCICPECS